jgi:general secretion pathway protein C
MGWTDELKTAAGRQAALVQYGPNVLAGLMAALIAIQAGFLVTGQNHGLAVPSPSHGSASGPIGPARSPDSAPAALHVSEITAAHLFGETQSTVNDANAPQTTVQLVLAGVLAVPDPKRGLAIIGPTAGSARLYTVGSAIPGGVTLYAVYQDRVLLDRDGSVESLLLPRKAPLAGTVANATPVSAGQRLAVLAQENGAVLGGLVRAQPVFIGTKLSGYRIYPGGRTSVGAFTHLGLRPGDLITAVNGTPLDDAGRANEILQTLSSMASANLTVQRNGQTQELSLNLETVASDAESAAAGGIRHEAPNGGPVPGRMFPPPGVIQAPPAAEPDENEPPPAEDPADDASGEQ